jgi:hypothetical protein
MAPAASEGIVMSHCIDHLRKWKRDGNFCGLGKQYASELDEWVSLIDKITKNGAGIDEESAVTNFTAGAARPLIRCKDPDIKTKALSYVISCLKRGETVTGGDLDATIKGFQGKLVKKTVEKPSVPVEPSTESLTIVKIESTPDTDVKEPEPAKNVTHGSSAFHTAAQELAAKKNGIAGEMFPEKPDAPATAEAPWSPAVCKTGKCPDNNDHRIVGKELGDKCNLSGSFIRDQKLCPIIERQRRAAAGGFVPEGQPRPITDEHRPLRIVKTPLTDEEKKSLADSFFERTGKTPKEIQQADELVSARYEGVKSRYELIDKAWSWFLAQAGGE